MLSSFVVLIDDREQQPWDFQGLKGDAGRHVLHVPTIRRRLQTGDYSIEGHEEDITIERKSLDDLFRSLGADRAANKKKIQRMAAYRYAAWVIEADWETILASPPAFSRMQPKRIYQTVLAWQLAYPSVHWWMCPNRRFAEITTYRLLERYWNWWTLHHERWGIPPAPPTADGTALESLLP